jgi:hypothetical protein
MSLIHSLRNVATKLGILRVIAVAGPQEPTTITTRTISLKDLTTELRASEVAALAQSPAHWHIPFEQVFDAAGIKPNAADLLLDKLDELTGPCKGLPREEAQARLLSTLAEQHVTVEELMRNAMARDKALDAYSQTLFENRQQRRRLQREKAAELRAQAAQLQNELQRIEGEARLDDKHWNDWWKQKVAYEQELASTLNYLLTEPIISIDAQLPPDHN